MDLLVGCLEQVTGYTYLAPPNKHSRNMTFAINLPTCTIKSELFTVVKIRLKTNPRLHYQPKRATTLLKGLKLTMVINHLLKEQKQKKQIQEYWQISYPNNEPLVQMIFLFQTGDSPTKTNPRWRSNTPKHRRSMGSRRHLTPSRCFATGQVRGCAAAGGLTETKMPRKCVASWNSKSNEF